MLDENEGEPIEPESFDYEFECSNEKNGRKYNWKIIVIEDTIGITITDKIDENGKSNIIYSKKYSKKELEEKNPNFLLFNEMTSLGSELEQRLKNNSYDLFDNISDITIAFKKEDKLNQLKKFEIRVPLRKNSDNYMLMLKLINYVKELNEKVQKLEKENKEIKKEKEEMKKELNNKIDKETYEKDLNKKYMKPLNERKRKEEKKKQEEDKNLEIDYKGLDPEKVNELYEELEEELNISSIMEKRVVIEKIIEVQCDRDAMNDWILEEN